MRVAPFVKRPCVRRFRGGGVQYPLKYLDPRVRDGAAISTGLGVGIGIGIGVEFEKAPDRVKPRKSFTPMNLSKHKPGPGYPQNKSF